jgi:hypothetical protein
MTGLIAPRIVVGSLPATSAQCSHHYTAYVQLQHLVASGASRCWRARAKADSALTPACGASLVLPEAWSQQTSQH